jgi:hypothetical protein
MRTENFEFLSNLDTLAAVVLGALLATAGGLVAEHYEDQIERKRRERDAARFFGEILASIDGVLDFAINSQKIGDPWGSVTCRMFKTAARESLVYERNRERLFDIRDTALRARVHRHFITEMFPLEALIDYSEEINRIETTLAEDPSIAAPRADRMRERAKDLRAVRERTLEVLVEEREKAAEISAALGRVAGVRFGLAGVEAAQATPTGVLIPAVRGPASRP